MQLVTSASPIIEEIGDSKIIIVDTETSSLYPHKNGRVLAGIGVKPLGKEGFYLPFRHLNGATKNASLNQLKELYLFLQNRTLVFHNCKFDLAVLWQEGLNLVKEDVLDTMVLMRLVREDEPSYELKALAKKYIDDDARQVESALKQQAKKMGWGDTNEGGKFEARFDMIPAEIIYDPYVHNDLRFTEELYTRAMELIEKRGLQELLELEKKVTRSLFWMELRGFKLDRTYVESEHKSLNKLVSKLEKRVYKLAGKELEDYKNTERNKIGTELFKENGCSFNMDAAADIGKIFEGIGITSPRQTPKKKAPSWAKDVLGEIEHPLADLIVQWRSADKIRDYYNGFLKFMGEDDILHPSIFQAGAKTGRTSCREPNLQNIPKFGGDINPLTGKPYSELEEEMFGKVRTSFVARPGYFLLLPDWEQIELRIFAEYAQEEDQLKIFDLGLDIHSMTALSAFGSMPEKGSQEYTWRRDIGKNIGFGLRYGLGDAGLAKRIHKTKEEAQQFKNNYFTRFPKARLFMDRVQRICIERGWVKNKWGRRRYLPPDKSYIAVNFLIQGTAADLMKDALWRVDEALYSLNAHELIPIHDEIINEIKYEDASKVIPLIAKEMETCDKLSVPIQCSLSWSPTNWGDKRSLACSKCSGKRKLFDTPEDIMLGYLYKNDMKALNAVKVKTCSVCKGKGYDLRIIENEKPI